MRSRGKIEVSSQSSTHRHGHSLNLTVHPKPIASPSILLPLLSSTRPFHFALHGGPLSFSGTSLELTTDPNPLNIVATTKKVVVVEQKFLFDLCF